MILHKIIKILICLKTRNQLLIVYPSSHPYEVLESKRLYSVVLHQKLRRLRLLTPHHKHEILLIDLLGHELLDKEQLGPVPPFDQHVQRPWQLATHHTLLLEDLHVDAGLVEYGPHVGVREHTHLPRQKVVCPLLFIHDA